MFRFIKRALSVTLFFVTLLIFFSAGFKVSSASVSTPEVVYQINCSAVLPLLEQWQRKFAENVTELSNGRIGFEFFPSGSLGNSTESITSCQMGSLDFVNGGDVELGPIIANSDWCSLPYYITSHEQGAAEVLNGFIGEFADKQYAEGGLISVSRVDNSFRSLGVKGKVINSSKDLKGLRIRVPNQPLALRVYELMGSLPVALSAGEVLIALQQGTVDGADNSIVLFEQFSQLELFDSVVLLNYGFGTMNLFCSAQTWKNISENDQKIIKDAGRKAADWYNAEALAQEAAIIERLKSEGKHVVEPDDAWKKELATYYDTIWEEALVSGKYDKTFIKQLHALYLKNTNR